ncbi:hypothetical protein D3C71_1639310 [compost metagenome]
MLLPLGHFMLQAFAPGGPVRQAGERVDQGLLALLFQVFAIALGFLLHARHPLRQALQTRCNFLLALVALLLVLVQGAEQALEVVLQYALEIFQVCRVLHAAVQAVDLLTELRVHLASGRTVVRVPVTGRLQVALEGFQALIELLEVHLELMLATVGDRQHQHRKIIEDR